MSHKATCTPTKPLNAKQAMFIKFYTTPGSPHFGNAIHAARAAGYGEGLGVGAHLLAKPNVAYAAKMATENALRELEAKLSAASMGQYPTKVEKKYTMENGERVLVGELETYDALAATKLALELHGRLVKKTELTGEGGGPVRLVVDTGLVKHPPVDVEAKVVEALPEGGEDE